MPTTGKNFVKLTSTLLPGSNFNANGVVGVATPQYAQSLSTAGLASILDKFSADLSSAGWAKNGCVILNLSPSTPKTIDFTNLAAETVVAGDLAFATWGEIIFANLGTQDVDVGPAASNPLRTPLKGTTPALTVSAGERTRWRPAAAKTVDSTHKSLTFDPGGSAAQIAVMIGGS